MNYLRCFFVLLFLFPANAHAQDYPTTGLLYGTKETDSIVHFCKKLEDGTLECQLTQTRVSKKAKKLSYEELRARAEKEFDDVKKDISEDKACGSFGLFVKALEGEISLEEAAEEGMKSGVITDKQAFIKGMEDFSDRQKQANLNSTKTLVSFCKNPTLDNYVEVISAGNERDASTCKVGPNTYEQRFKYVQDYSSGAGAWVVISEPTGPCGIINLSRFEKEVSKLGDSEFTHWNYVAKKAVTNPKGEVMGPEFSCSDLDEEEYPYSWKSKEHYLGCEIIEFSPF